MRGLFLVIARLCFPLAIYWWSCWSRVHRRLLEDRRQRAEVPTGAHSPEKAQLDMLCVKWKPDTWRQLWDVCGSAARFAYILKLAKNGEQPDLNCDCDDFAAYAVDVLAPAYKARVLTVSWQRARSWKFGGHAVCLYVDDAGDLRHIGNWGRSRAYHPQDMGQLVAEMTHRAGGDRVVGWALYDKDLHVKAVHRGS